MEKRTRCITVKFDGIANVLITPATIFPAFDPRTTSQRPTSKTFQAIWDTGASHTAISKRVIDALGLKATGMTIVQTADARSPKPTYFVNIMLPSNVGFANIRVTEANLGKDQDMLIGMDIIAKGDFAITNLSNKTTFSFAIPSTKCIDFVEENRKKDVEDKKEANKKEAEKNEKQDKKVGRNAPCPCGSGHKYKKCCGK